ncbi:hypothetical protein RRSWK_03740 [Rhodopirellula sp. SWK7]|nr:hypothetical protein RRSWK_03740 [Rhodopirellula sp. SWK7]
MGTNWRSNLATMGWLFVLWGGGSWVLAGMGLLGRDGAGLSEGLG